MHKPVMLMDTGFRLRAELPLYQSLMIKREYYGVGSFSLTLPRDAAGWQQLERDRILYLPNRPESMMLIEKVTLNEQTVTAEGCMLKGLAKRRICVPPLNAGEDPYRGFGWDRFTGDAESAYLHYAAVNLTAPEDANRRFPSLVLAENLHRGDTLPWQARFDRLTDVFRQIGEKTELGWDIRPDFHLRQFVFGAWEGRDRTTGVSRAVFSREMGSASTVTWMQDDTAAVSTVYAGGEGNDENRMVYSVGGENAGFARRESFTELSGADTVEMLTLGAQRKLSPPKETLTAQVRDGGLCQYLTDYDVGDRVSIVAEGRRVDARLIAMQETHEGGQVRLSATFGDAPATLLSRLAGQSAGLIV